MKVTIVTCFESNEERVNFIYDACEKKGYEVEAISTDFSHIKKEKRSNVSKRFITIETKAYNKNLSIDRLLSHKKFAEDAFAYISKDIPDLLWVVAPANSLIKQANIFKKNHPEVKVVVDIIDMWPESLPVSINKNILPFNIWRNIRSKNLDNIDCLVSECDLYKDILEKEYQGNIHTIYMASGNEIYKGNKKLNDKKLSLCYLGSINNIIDVDKIAETIKKIDRDVVVHVIGEGESTDTFIRTLKQVCEVIYHGAIRDEKKKSEILAECHAGINIYRDGLYIGLTTKCIDYFKNGLPILNNIKGDTYRMVKEDGVGFNIDDDLVAAEDIIEKRKHNKNVYQLYKDNFTKDVFMRRCLDVIDEVMQ